MSQRRPQQTGWWSSSPLLYAKQWGPAAIGLPAAWDLTTGSTSVTVSVIDTGLAQLTDFAGRVVSPYSVYYGSSAYQYWNDKEGHGTGCSRNLGCDRE
jgi:thermitase